MWYQVKVCPECDIVLGYNGQSTSNFYHGVCQGCGKSIPDFNKVPRTVAYWKTKYFWPFSTWIGNWILKKDLPPEALAKIVNKRK
jgi:hypothetical protein